GALSVGHFQSDGEEIRIWHFVVFDYGKIGCASASLGIVNIVAIFAVRIERHPQGFAEGNLCSIFRVTIVRRHRHKRRIMFRERIEIAIHDALETAFVASVSSVGCLYLHTKSERDESEAQRQYSGGIANKRLQTKTLCSGCVHCFLVSSEGCRCSLMLELEINPSHPHSPGSRAGPGWNAK